MKLSICIPIHDIEAKELFLDRSLTALASQTFKNFEVVITDDSPKALEIPHYDLYIRYFKNHSKLGMAGNTNQAIKHAQGEIIKILYLDDYLANEHALQDIVDAFKGGWLVSGCSHNIGGVVQNEHYPTLDERLSKGINTIGSPSVLAFENKNPLLFDEAMSWVLDIDLYLRLYEKYGLPTILNEVNVIIGIHGEQMTNVLPDERKEYEGELLNKKLKK